MYKLNSKWWVGMLALGASVFSAKADVVTLHVTGSADSSVRASAYTSTGDYDYVDPANPAAIQATSAISVTREGVVLSVTDQGYHSEGHAAVTYNYAANTNVSGDAYVSGIVGADTTTWLKITSATQSSGTIAGTIFATWSIRFNHGGQADLASATFNLNFNVMGTEFKGKRIITGTNVENTGFLAGGVGVQSLSFPAIFPVNQAFSISEAVSCQFDAFSDQGMPDYQGLFLGSGGVAIKAGRPVITSPGPSPQLAGETMTPAATGPEVYQLMELPEGYTVNGVAEESTIVNNLYIPTLEVPEPGALGFLALGSGLLAWRRRRER